MKSIWIHLISALAVGFSLTSCLTPVADKFGVQKSHLAQIPARITVLPCRKWPQGALYPNQEKLGVSDAEVTGVCDRFDKYVLAGFDGQPYMRGIAPQVVKQLLEREPKGPQLDQLDDLWFRPGQACEACRNGMSYYKEVVAVRSDWRLWLSGLSRSTTGSDAVLFPFLVEAQGRIIDDRGIYYATRSAEILLLLVDTNNGELIWSGGKRGEIRLPLDNKPTDPSKIMLPPWEDVYGRLFVPEIWAEFPGRQG